MLHACGNRTKGETSGKDIERLLSRTDRWSRASMYRACTQEGDERNPQLCRLEDTGVSIVTALHRNRQDGHYFAMRMDADGHLEFVILD